MSKDKRCMLNLNAITYPALSLHQSLVIPLVQRSATLLPVWMLSVMELFVEEYEVFIGKSEITCRLRTQIRNHLFK